MGHEKLCASAVGLGLMLAATVALASDGAEDGAGAQADVSVAAGALLPITIAPRVDTQRAAVLVVSGYDDAHRSATLVSAAELHLGGAFALRIGMTYLPNADQGAFQPHIGLRWQPLQQQRHGVDAALGLFYRRERYTPDEGLLQVMAAISRQFERTSAFLNVSYGQDPEGDDRDGETRAAALFMLMPNLQVGMDGRARIDLFSRDPRRAARGESDLDFTVGPLACVTVGRLALLGQAGISGVRTGVLRVGPVVTAGAGGVF